MMVRPTKMRTVNPHNFHLVIPSRNRKAYSLFDYIERRGGRTSLRIARTRTALQAALRGKDKKR